MSVNFIKNTAFDFGTGKSYDIISIVQLMNKCSVLDALEYLKKFDFSEISKTVDNVSDNPNYTILKIGEVVHPGLIEYLKSRKVLKYKNLVKEIHYSFNKRIYFGIGFFNNSEGVEVRSKYGQNMPGQKDVTWIKDDKSQNTEVAVFEGFFDYLSYKIIEEDISSYSNTDYLVLNSTSMLSGAEVILKKYEKKSLFLDNDTAGKAAKKEICLRHTNVEDCSLLYKDYQDLNQWLCR